MPEDGQVTSRRKPAVTVIPADPAAADGARADGPAKPTLERLQADLAALDWQRSGTGAGSFEVAFVSCAGPGRADWVLLRVAGDPGGECSSTTGPSGCASSTGSAAESSTGRPI